MSKAPTYLDAQGNFEGPLSVRCIIPHPDDPYQVLLVWRNDDGKQSNMWEVTGGKKAPHEPNTISLQDVVRAEMIEEVGVDVDADHLHWFKLISYVRGDTGQERPEGYFILDSKHYMAHFEKLVGGTNVVPGSDASKKAYDEATGDEGLEHTHAAWVDIRSLGDENNPIMRGSGILFRDFSEEYIAAV